MKYIEVDKEGNVSFKGDPRFLYSVMLNIRVQIVQGASYHLGHGLTIATRYASVRRQFANVEGSKLERKILDYQTHMFKLAPLLAYSLAFNFSARELCRL